MRKVLMALALLGLAGGAVADDLSGGALICHNVPDLGYTTWVEEFEAEAPLSWWCEQYVPLTSCDDQVNEIYNSEEYTFYDNFYVLAAWAEPKTFCAVEFGLGAYDNGLVSFSQHGACGIDPATIPTTDPAWPSPGSGIAIAWAVVNAPSGNFVPVYFFGCYLYGAYYGSTQFPLINDPATDFAGFASCEVPPVTYDAYSMGALGLNEEGIFACYEEPPPREACCFGPECVLMYEAECIDAGGVWYGGPCDPNPCPDEEPWACCFGPDCLMLFEADCIDQGGVFQGVGVTCDPNPCPQPGACCFGCVCEVLMPDVCLDQGGEWYGGPCDPNPCPPCEYACCFPGGECQVATEDVCAELGGTVYYDYMTCEPNPCPDLLGACCFPQEGHPCIDDTFEEDCYEMGGVAWFVDETCATAPCDQYTPTDKHSWGEIKDMYR